MENPASWTHAEKVVSDVIANHEHNRRQSLLYPENTRVGWSLTSQITHALRQAGLLEQDEDGSYVDLRFYFNTEEEDDESWIELDRIERRNVRNIDDSALNGIGESWMQSDHWHIEVTNGILDAIADGTTFHAE